MKLADGKISWQCSYSGDDPVSHYEIIVDGKVAGKVEHKPQLLKSRPFWFELEKAEGEILVAAVDAGGNRAEAKLA